jgi:hypothetical protein
VGKTLRGEIYARGRLGGLHIPNFKRPTSILKVKDKQDMLRRTETYLPHLPEMCLPATSAFLMPMGYYTAVEETLGTKIDHGCIYR